MSGTGRVVDIVGAPVPDTGKPARRVTVEVPGGRWTCFDIPCGGPEPAVGETISWGPHHCEWPGNRVAKLTWEMDPNAPLQ